MIKLRSLSAKYVFISSLLLLFFGVYMMFSFVITNYMEGDAKKINVAGRERMLTYLIASHLHFITQSAPSPERDLHAKGVERAMDDYEEALFGLKNGSEKMGLEPLHEHDVSSQAQLDELISLWKNDQRPLLTRIIGDPKHGKNGNCNACHAAVRANIVNIESLVKKIEEHHDRELGDYNRYRVYALAALMVMAGGLFVYTRRSLIMPAKHLKGAAGEIEKGNFDVSVDIRTRDEIGSLGAAFNSMARRLKDLFAEKEEHLHELNILNEIAIAASQTLSLEAMLDKVLDAILKLPPFARVGKGSVHLFDPDAGVLRLTVSRNFPEAQVLACGVLRPGECLCGLCMEQGDIILTERSIGEERHSKTYPGMVDHGHVVLPLKSRERMIGVLSFYLQEGTTPSPKEVKLYRSIADILSVSIQNALNHKQVAMLAQSLESSMDLIVITDVEGMILHVNPQVETYLGYTQEGLRGRHISLMQSPRVAALWEEIHRATLTHGGWRGEIINIKKDGTEYPVLLSTSLVKYENNNVIALIGIVCDISDQKRAEETLRQSEKRYRQLFDLLPYGGEVLDTEGLIVDCSISNTRLLGYEREELIGRHVTEIMHQDSLPMVQEKFRRLLEGIPVQAEIRMVRKDGSVIDVARAAQPIVTEDGRVAGVLALSVDITDRKRTENENRNLQSQLLQAQKLESIGRLAGGVAHDFNNILSVILGYSELILRKLPEGDPLRENLAIINDAGQRAAVLTRQLLAFSRKQALSLKILTVDGMIRDIMKILTRMIGEDVSLEVKLSSAGKIIADPGQLEQVLMNLAVNARDAMLCGGRLIIATSDVELDDTYAAGHEGVRPGPYVLLSVTDTGAGMSREVQERIFEPFFTTKETGKGTGLGLAMVYGIVKQHNGHIWVYSEAGKGTTFNIYLPVVQGADVATIKQDTAVVQRGTETVLVAEDESSIRMLITDTLRPLGYRVLEASCGAEAVHLSDTMKEQIDLLLTDVIMPGMSGHELAKTLVSRRPGMKVIFMSGYPDEAIAPYGVLKPGMVFLQKPLTLGMLTQTVREVLDGKKE